MGIEKRLQLIMASNHLTASSFADRIGVQRSNVSHVLNGRNKPGYDFLLKVVHAFPKVNTHWLLTGEDASVNSAADPISAEQINPEKLVESNKTARNPADKKDHTDSSKKIIKTIVFYDDFSFDAFVPNEK